MMILYLKVIIPALIIFLIIDFIWLGALATKLYQAQLGSLIKEKFNMIAAFIFYIVFIIGLSVFVIVPGIESESISKIVILGALFGFVTYATYDLTNYATLEGFPITIVMIDLAWGTFVATLTSLLTYLFYQGVLS